MYIIAQAPAAAVLTPSAGAATAAFAVAAGEPGAGTQCNLNVLGTNRLNGQGFTVRASGYVNCPAGTYTSSATPLTLALNWASTASFAAVAGNIAVSTAAIAIFTYAATVSAQIPFEFEAEVLGAGTSTTPAGVVQGFNAPGPNGGAVLAIARAAANNIPTSVNFSSEPPLQFAVSVITPASNLLAAAGVTLVLSQLVLEA